MKVKRLYNMLEHLGVLYPKSGEAYLDRQRDALFARLIFISAIMILSKVVINLLYYGITPIFFIDVLAAFFILATLLVFRSQQILSSKILYLILVNFFIATMCLLLPRERLIFVYFFPMIAVAYSIFPGQESKWTVSFIVLSSALLAILVLIDFKLLGDVQTTMYGSRESNRALNVIFSIGLIFFCIDFLIRNSHESETVLRNMTRDIQKKNEDLQKINSELDRFVYSTSHDLRAPLLSIQGLIQIASVECNEPKMKQYLNLIDERTCKLDDFIKEIIDYSRNARTELKPELTNLRSLIFDVINNLKYMAGAERIQFKIDFHSDEVLLIDKNRIKIVLSNLVSNAIKYYNPHEDVNWVQVHVANKDGKCQIKIIDNGIGIKPEFQNRIFEMFFRATEKSTGSGLGLYIVKEILDKMKASISLTSDYGKGSNFIITLPFYNENQ